MSFLPLAAGGCFFYFSLAARAAALAISSFSPASGQPGNVVTVNGSGFASALLVQFNPISPTPADFTILSDTQLQLVIPVGAVSGPLQVLTASASATSAASLQVAPVIAGFSPPSGAAGTLVFINGANFVTNGTTVVFSGQNASVQGNVVALTEVSATVPSGAVTGPITVMTSAGASVSTSFVISTTPVITGFSTRRRRDWHDRQHLRREFHLTAYRHDQWGKNAAASLVSLSQLDATVPANATSGPITVTTDFGSATTGSNLVTGTGPIITDFSPTLGNSSTPVIINGLNLAAATKVTFNGKEATIVADQNTQLEVYPPAGSGIGPISITTPLGTATTSTNFTNSAASIVTDFNPVIGPPGTVVTIDGLNFSDVTSVTFNGASAAFAVLGAGGTQVSATVPNNATTGPIKITAGASSYITSSNFTVTTSAPVITGFSPTNGVRGQTVTLTGANFTELANPAVEFNGIAATYQTPTSTTELMVNVPADFLTGPITVLNSRGSATSTNLFYGQPWITSLSSTSAIVNASFTINGRSLLNASSVRVNGVNYNYSAASTQITATVPTNAGTGLIEIVTPGGDFISTNLFAILPKIYSFSPAIGPAGTVVTLSGTSLFDVTNVEFGGIKAASFTGSTNQVQATVPVNGLQRGRSRS